MSPEIDSIRAQVFRQTAQQRVTNAEAGLAKDKLILARMIGLPLEQSFVLADDLPYQPFSEPDVSSEVQKAESLRSDLRSAQARLRAAEERVRAASGERLSTLSVAADYGAIGPSIGSRGMCWSPTSATMCAKASR